MLGILLGVVFSGHIVPLKLNLAQACPCRLSVKAGLSSSRFDDLVKPLPRGGPVFAAPITLGDLIPECLQIWAGRKSDLKLCKCL